MYLNFRQLFIFFLLLIWCYSSAFSQRVNSFAIANDSIRQLYQKDADRLAVRNAFNDKNSYKDSVQINQSISQRYLKALLAVYNATALPARDTVIRLLNIHSYNPGLNSLYIRAASSLVWMNNLKNDQFPTGNSTLDYLLQRYRFHKTYYSNLFQPNLIVLKSDINYNLEALACSFEAVFGLSSVHAELLYGDGNDIQDSLKTDGTELIYTYAWDECRNNCRQRRSWRFKVYSDYSVEYLGCNGNTLEPGLEMMLLEGQLFFSELKIYPNPVKDKLYLELHTNKTNAIKLSIVNQKGDLVYSHSQLLQSEMIDLGHLLMGTYQLILEQGPQKKIYKLKKNNNPLQGY